MDHLTIARTILTQLGGNKFIAMTGARGFSSHDAMTGAKGPALSFQLPSRFAKGGINYVKVYLTPADTYSVAFYKVGPQPSMKRMLQGAKQTITLVAEVDDVHVEQLRSIFSSHTGLDTHL